MFITLEDESGVANLVIWPSLYEKQRRLILTASMMGIEGRVQREREVVHVVVLKFHALSGKLASLGEREAAFRLPHGRGDEFHHGRVGGDVRTLPPRRQGRRVCWSGGDLRRQPARGHQGTLSERT
ncbi:MAG: OB-fold nucleic acid binding domain-containing protein [Janthinobacterium lividum]